MRIKPAYFAVTEPMRVLVAVGCSDSNAWIGSSRVIDTRYEARNARPGSTIHSLAGGTFLQEADGTLHEMRLRTPKPIMEKSHGGTYTDWKRLDDMLAAGRIAAAAAPPGADYAAARARGRVRLPPLQGGTVVLEESAELAAFRADIAGIAAALEADGASLRYVDLGEDDAVRLRITHPGAKEAGIARSAIDLRTSAHGALPEGSPLADAFAEVSGKGALSREDFMDAAAAVAEPHARQVP